MTPIPRTRDQVERLMQKLGYDHSQLGPEEVEMVRKLYFLDDDRTIEQRVRDAASGDLTGVPLPRTARIIRPRQGAE